MGYGRDEIDERIFRWCEDTELHINSATGEFYWEHLRDFYKWLTKQEEK